MASQGLVTRMRAMRPALALCFALVACGGPPTGLELSTATHLFVVAHQDDDILFMQPDVSEALPDQIGAVTVYVTAGDAGHGLEYAKRRYAQSRAAYGKVVVDNDWNCGFIELAGHAAEHCTLASLNVSLVFLGYPDGGFDGSAKDSLLQLWEGNIGSATTIADKTTSYDQQGLIDALAAVITDVEPTSIATLEVASTHGTEHSDHMLVGALTLLAAAQAGSTAELTSFRGANTLGEPANKPASLLTQSEIMLDAYGPDDNATTNADWVARRYAVGFRLGLVGALRNNGQCLVVESDGSLVMGDCTNAPEWATDGSGEIHDATSHCLDALPTGEISYDACTGGASHHFFVDDEGHVWAPITPTASPDMAYAHLDCLTTGGGRIHASLCGQSGAPTWDFVATPVETTRTALGLVSTGRAIRIGDMNGDGLGDLCAVEQGGLMCAYGNGAGGFAAATMVTQPFAVDPQSLAMGPVKFAAPGDSVACGLALDGSGPVCVLAAPPGGAAQPFAPVFVGTPVAGTSPSLAVTSDGYALSAVTSQGVEYASHAQRASQVVASWPPPGSVMWTAALAQDPTIGEYPYEDYCIAAATGPLCAPALEPGLPQSGGVPWGYWFQNVPDPSPQDETTGALADIDGDGRADLCGLDLTNNRVACARSQGRGFGPRTTLFALPAGVTPTALWLGDLNNDGKADACVDVGATVDCSLSR